MNTSAFLLLTVGLTVAVAENVDFYTDCGSKTGVIKSIDVAGCTEKPCKLPRGDFTTFEVKFDSKVNSETLTAKVYGHLAIGNIKWNGVPEDACTGTSCPLESGKSYSYKVDINVKESYPKVKFTVKYELVDENGDDVVCFQLPAQLE